MLIRDSAAHATKGLALMKRSRTHALGILLAATVLTLTACGGDQQSDAAAGGPFNQTDVNFVQKMLPHHMQALRTSQIVIERGADPDVKKIARGIVQAQEREIAEMQGFLRRFKAPRKPVPADQQAVWNKNVADEAAADSPARLDVIFLLNMIPHHSAAVPMAQMEIEKGAFGPARRLAQQIKTTQRREIMQMKDLVLQKTS
jgi:uncharacterized protein (DUF305 family)